MSKYIDADKIRSEVERIQETGCESPISVCNDILSFIDFLQQEQPSLPDLDEAARDIVIKMHPCLKDCTILGDRLTRGQLMALVKAGAEWAMQQLKGE